MGVWWAIELQSDLAALHASGTEQGAQQGGLRRESLYACLAPSHSLPAPPPPPH